MLYEYTFGEIHIRHAVDENPNARDFNMHIHEQCEIFFYISGNVNYLVEGSIYPLTPGSLMLMRPHEVHAAQITGIGRYERFSINFPTDFIKPLDPKLQLLRPFTDRPLGKNNILDSSVTDSDKVKNLFLKMTAEYEDEYEKQFSIRTGLVTLLDMIYRFSKNHMSTDELSDCPGKKYVSYVNNHLFEPLSVSELAAHFFISQAQFNRVFKKSTGASPWEYITKKRLTAAKEKIRNGSPAILAAESCGFNDYSSFYRAYTGYFGNTPISEKPKIKDD